MKEQTEELFKMETETEQETEQVIETEIIEENKVADGIKGRKQSKKSFENLNNRVIVSHTPYSRAVRKLIENGNVVKKFIDENKEQLKNKEKDKQQLLPYMEDFGISIKEENKQDIVKVASKNRKGKTDSKGTFKVKDYKLLYNVNTPQKNFIQLRLAIDSEIYNKIYIKHYNMQNIPDIELKPEDFISGGKYPLYSDSYSFYRALTETYFNQLQNFLVPYETIIKKVIKTNNGEETIIEKPGGIKWDLIYTLVIDREEKKIYIRLNNELTKEDLKRLLFGSYTKATRHILTEYNDNLKTKFLIRLLDHKRINESNKKRFGFYPVVKMGTILNDINAITEKAKVNPTIKLITPIKNIIEQINNDDKLDFRIETDIDINKMRLAKFLDIKVKIFDK